MIILKLAAWLVGGFVGVVVLMVAGAVIWANCTPDPEAVERARVREAQRLDGYTADALNDASAEWPVDVSL